MTKYHFTGLSLLAFQVLFGGVAQAEQPRVILETTEGNIVIQLDQDKAPITAKNFIDYAKSGYFAGTTFHRVIPGFVIQGGGMTPDMKEKPGQRTPIKNEAGNGLNNKRGTLSMARTSDPDSATSQFFINLSDNASLDRSARSPGYAVFGQVVEGMDVVDKIAKAPTGSVGMHDDVPKKAVVINSAKVVEGK